MKDEFNLKDEQKAQLRMNSIEKKKFMLDQRFKLNNNINQSKFKRPEDYANFLKENINCQSIRELNACINSLRVELTCQSVLWVKDFGHNNGHIHLLEIIRRCSRKIHKEKSIQEMIYNCISCIYPFMNNKVCE